MPLYTYNELCCHFEMTRYPCFSQLFLWGSKFKREYCLTSRLCCQNLFSLWTTPPLARYPHFPSSGLQCEEHTSGCSLLVSSCLSESQFLSFMRGSEEWENPLLESRVVIPTPTKFWWCSTKAEPQSWALCFRYSLRMVFRLWVLCLKCFHIHWTCLTVV